MDAAAILREHQAAGWNQTRTKKRAPYLCKCGLAYSKRVGEDLAAHQADELRRAGLLAS